MTRIRRPGLSRFPTLPVLAVGGAVLLLLLWMKWGPMDPLFDAPRATVLLDRNGALLGASVADDEQWRFPPCSSLPPRFATCLIQFEDRHFRSHFGIHPPSILRALVQNARSGRVVSGGSTLTMQVARLSRSGQPRTIGEKLIEMGMALRIEMRQDKEEILALFASNAPFGGNVVGLDAAAWRYYGVAPSDLSWAEAATLAVLPNAPSVIYPGRGQAELRRKRDRLLQRLLEIGELDSLDWSLALEEPLPAGTHPLPQRAPHLLATMKALGHEGELIRTTLDGALQDLAAEIVRRHGAALVANEVHNAAAIILDVPTGEVLAYVGNLPDIGAEHAGQVDIVRAQRSTGSILKPFLHADMLQCGERMPDMLVADLPTRYDGFAPLNYDEQYLGAVPASQALARSLNVPAVRALHEHGVERTVKLLQGMGMRSIDRRASHYGLSLIVGGAESSLWELSGAYASMGRVTRLFSGSGSTTGSAALVHPPVIQLNAAPPHAGEDRTTAPVLHAASIHFTLKALREVKRPESEGDWQRFAGSEAIAWKTGTSFGHRDAWAIGLTDRYCAGVWTGNADGEGRPGLTGTLAAAPVLFELFGALPDGRGFDPPYDEMVKAAVCSRSGFRASVDCDAVDTTWIPREALRTPVCPFHQRILVDVTARHRVPPGNDARPVIWFSLPPAMEHYYAAREPAYRALPPWKDERIAGDAGSPMEMIYPEADGRLLLPVQLDGSRGKVVLEAAHRYADVPVHWHLDGSYLGTTTGEHRMAVSPAEGRHRLTLTDASGRVLELSFDVIGATRPSS